MQQITLSDMLANEVKTNGLDEKLARLIETVAACGVEISSEVACRAKSRKNSTSSATTSSPRPCLSWALSPPVLRKKWITVWQPTVQIAAPISSATTRLTAQATSTSTSRSERSFRSCPIRTKTLPLRRTPTFCSPATVSLPPATSCTVRKRRWRSLSAAAW